MNIREQGLKALMSAELVHSLSREITKFQLAWSKLSSKEIEWEQAAQEWLRVGFPQWKKAQWDKAIGETERSIGETSTGTPNNGANGNGSVVNTTHSRQLRALAPAATDLPASASRQPRLSETDKKAGCARWILVRDFDDEEPGYSGHTSTAA